MVIQCMFSKFIKKRFGAEAKYIGKEIVFNKKIKGNLFFEKYGLALGFDIKGVDRGYTNFDGIRI